MTLHRFNAAFPASAAIVDSSTDPMTLGVVYRLQSAGQITHVRVPIHANQVGKSLTVFLALPSDITSDPANVLITTMVPAARRASASPAAGTGGTWLEVPLSTPVTVAAGAYVLAGVAFPSQSYWAASSAFGSDVANGTGKIIAAGSANASNLDGYSGNGRFYYPGSGQTVSTMRMPVQSFNNGNYYVDLVFDDLVSVTGTVTFGGAGTLNAGAAPMVAAAAAMGGAGALGATGAPAAAGAAAMGGSGALAATGSTGGSSGPVGLYKPTGLARWNAALAAATPGSSRLDIAVAGHSIVFGKGSANTNTETDAQVVDKAWVHRLRLRFAPTWGDAGEGLLIPVQDSRSTRSGGAASQRSPFGQGYRVGQGSTAKIGSVTLAGTEIWVSYWQDTTSTTGPVTVTVDGVATVFPQRSEVNTTVLVKVTGLADTDHTVEVTGPSNRYAYIASYGGARGTGVGVHRFGRAGATVNMLTRGPSETITGTLIPKAIRDSVVAMGPKLVILEFLTNDQSLQQTPIADFKSRHQELIDHFVAAGACVLLLADPENNAAAAGITETDYWQALKDLADLNEHVAAYSIKEQWGSYATANAAGLYMAGSSVHPSTLGHQDIADRLYGVLTTPAGSGPTAAATLTGSGTLAATGAPAAAGAAALAGAGALTATVTPATTGTAALAGAGSLTAAAALASSGTANLVGAGTLVTTGTQASGSATAILTGTGTLTAGGVAPGTVEITGNGLLTATATTASAAAAALAGAGTLTASATPATSTTAALTGTGTLSAAGTSAGGVNVTLGGSGALTVGVRPSTTAQAALAGTGVLAATPTSGQSAVALTGNGTLTATGRPTLTAAASLTGLGELAVYFAPPAGFPPIPARLRLRQPARRVLAKVGQLELRQPRRLTLTTPKEQ